MNIKFKWKSNEIKEKVIDEDFFAVNSLYKMKRDFDPSEFDLKSEDFTHIETNINEVAYYVNDKIVKRKIIQNNSEVLFSYDDKRSVIKKITKTNNGKLTDFKVVKYGQTKESALYRFNGKNLQKKAIFFFKDEYKYRGAIYYVSENTLTGIERITYEKDTQRIKTKTVYKFKDKCVSILFERYSNVNSVIQSNRIQIKGDKVISIDSKILKSSIINLSAKRGKESYNIELTDNTKYGLIKLLYNAPVESVDKAFKFHEGDYNNVSILFPDDKLCVKSNYQIK